MIVLRDLFSARRINEMIDKNAYTHTYYYHYSKIKAIQGILTDKKIWVSSMCFSNDKTEHCRFGGETYRYFQLCFSTGTTENLPLWFLYSGKNGKGARITFSRSAIKSLVNCENMQMELVNLREDKKIKLINGKNCKIEFKDILYRKREQGKYRLKYNTQVHNNFPVEEMQEIEKENKGFLKDIIWFYEKETRLLIEVNEELLDKELFKDVEKPPYRVELGIPEVCYKDIAVLLSPAYDEKAEEVEKILRDESFILLNRAKVFSEYAGQLKIDLCADCENK